MHQIKCVKNHLAEIKIILQKRTVSPVGTDRFLVDSPLGAYAASTLANSALDPSILYFLCSLFPARAWVYFEQTLTYQISRLVTVTQTWTDQSTTRI